MSSPSSSIRHETRSRARGRGAPRHGLRVFGISALALSLWSATAAAKTTVAGDLDYAAPIDSRANSGWGFGIRLGQQFHVPLVVINPELGFTYHTFSDDSSPKAYRGIAGLRLGIGEIFRIGPFGHIGVGHLSLSGTPDLSHTAFTYDAGLFLDLTVIPLLDVGVHGAYNRIVSGSSGPALQFATVGAHVALVF
jgi:hypothetical protein